HDAGHRARPRPGRGRRDAPEREHPRRPAPHAGGSHRRHRGLQGPLGPGHGPLISQRTGGSVGGDMSEQAGEPSIDWDAWTEQATAWLSEYIRVDTVNPPGNETRAVEWLGRI